MNTLYNIYFALPNFSFLGIIGKIINRILSIILKHIFDIFVPPYLKRTASKSGFGLNTEERDETYIVSLTSFPARINDIWISIETILRQSFKPDKIILWLANEQFPDKKLPDSLLQLKKRGLTIEFCEDLRSHKKYYYSIRQFPKANLITLDDDLYYHNDVLKNIVDLHKKFPRLITTNRAHKFRFNDRGIKSYRKWKHNVTTKKPSHLLMQTGGAGTLYPPGSLYEKTFDQKLIKDLCFHADDLWLKMMAYLNNVKIVTNRLYNKDFLTITQTQKEKLVTQNVISGGNDQQLKNVCEYFKIDLSEIKNKYDK